MRLLVGFVPQPPLLLPEYASAADPGAEVRAAGMQVIQTMLDRAGGGTGGDGSGPVLLLAADDLAERVGRTLIAAVAAALPVLPVRGEAQLRAALGADQGQGGSGRTGLLLVCGDGSGLGAVLAPGVRDPRARAVDDRVAEALAGGDPTTLAELDERLCAELLVSGREVWSLVGELLRDEGTQVVVVRAETMMPFEVCYHFAVWDCRFAGEHS